MRQSQEITEPVVAGAFLRRMQVKLWVDNVEKPGKRGEHQVG